MDGARHAEARAQSEIQMKWTEVDDPAEWDRFITANGGSIFHQWGWRKVLEGEGVEPLYLACRDRTGAMVAACPFFYQTGKHHLSYLNSLPDSLMAGPVIADVPKQEQIIESMRKSRSFPIVAMRVRVHDPAVIKLLQSLKFKHTPVAHSLFILNLQECPPRYVWDHGFERHDRRAVTTYEKLHADFRFAEKDEDFQAYLSLEAGTSWGHSGDLVAEKELLVSRLSKMRQHLGDKLKLALTTMDGKVMVGLPLLCDPAIGTVHAIKALRYCPERNVHEPMANTTFINWKAISWAFDNGFKHVVLGSYRISDSSNPEHDFYRLRKRFALTIVPWYEFILPTSTVYPLASSINKLVGRQ